MKCNRWILSNLIGLGVNALAAQLQWLLLLLLRETTVGSRSLVLCHVMFRSANPRLLARSVSKSSYDVARFLEMSIEAGRPERNWKTCTFEAARYITCLEDTLFECWRLSKTRSQISDAISVFFYSHQPGLERWQDEKTRDQRKVGHAGFQILQRYSCNSGMHP